MKKVSKVFALLLMVCFMVSIIAACGSAGKVEETKAETAAGTTKEETQKEEPTKEAKKLKFGIIYLTAEHPYYQAHAKHTQEYCKEKGIDLVELDGKIDQANMTSQMENLVAQNVDGIIYCLLEGKAASADINAAQEAGIPVVTFAIPHDKESANAPFVGIPEVDAGALGGEAAGEYWKKNNPDKKPVICTIEQVGQPTSTMRADGFIAGFKKIFPDVEVVARIDGKGVKDKSMSVTEDFLQKNSTANVFYGINGDSALGALAALEARGRGTLKTELVVSHDGSEPEVMKIADPESSLKIAVANKPKELAKGAVDTLLEIIDGKRDIKNTDDIMINAAIINGDDIDGAQTFIKDEYFSKVELKK